MCLIVRKEDFCIKKSEEDIFAYKLLINSESVVFNFKYKSMKLNKTSITFKPSDIGDKSYVEYIEVNQGFHSYINKLKGNYLVFIPKGSEIVYGKSNYFPYSSYDYDTIVSDSIVLIGKIDSLRTKVIKYLLKYEIFKKWFINK